MVYNDLLSTNIFRSEYSNDAIFDSIIFILKYQTGLDSEHFDIFGLFYGKLKHQASFCAINKINLLDIFTTATFNSNGNLQRSIIASSCQMIIIV